MAVAVILGLGFIDRKRNMLDINLLRVEKGGNPELVRESQRRRFKPESTVDDVIALDVGWRSAQFTVDKTRAELGKVDKQFAQLRRLGSDCSELLVQKQELKKKENELKVVADNLKRDLDSALASLGNLVHDSVPVSSVEEDKVVVRQWGDTRREEQLDNHVTLFEKIGGADFSRGTKVAGNRGYYLVGAGVSLNIALAQYGLQFLEDRGYKTMQTPVIMEKSVMKRCAQLSQFDEELYEIAGEEKYLIATSEQPLCGYFEGKILPPAALPIRLAGYSSCFRKEAGSHGKDTLGLFRVHEFQKVEQFCVTSPEASWEMLEEMLRHSEDFYKELELPYRVVNVVSGELNNSAAKKYDLEAWFPAAGKYFELVSCSNCTDYQARNLNVKTGGNFVHLLNSTLTASQRTLCCILENYQTPTGIRVPAVLQRYMGYKKFLPFSCTDMGQQESKCTNQLVEALPKFLDDCREELLPLVALAVKEQSNVDQTLVRKLVYLVLRPNQQQREVIVDACVSLAKKIGGVRFDAEFLPLCWKLAESQYSERRLLLAQLCTGVVGYLDGIPSTMLALLDQYFLDPAANVQEGAVLWAANLNLAGEENSFSCSAGSFTRGALEA